MESGVIMILANGSTPHGLCPNGTVRTTGWLQIGYRPISSGLWAVLGGFFLTLPLARGPLLWLPFVCALAGYALWKMFTMVVHPCSRAVNYSPCTAGELFAGQLIRLYGSAGPVGEIVEVEEDTEGWQHIWLFGGEELVFEPTHRVWRVELRN